MHYCNLTEARDITAQFDGKVYRYFFNCIPETKINEPERISYISEYIVTVSCTRSLIRMFDIDDVNMEKILYWVARRHLEQNLEQTEIRIYLNSRNYPKGFPFDTSIIKYPSPEVFPAKSSRRIGF